MQILDVLIALALGLLGLGGVLAYFTWQDVTLGDDYDAPQHVARRDWAKVSERRTR